MVKHIFPVIPKAIPNPVVNHLRWSLAVVWTFLWSNWRLATGDIPCWGRHESPQPVCCDVCGWAGPMRWLLHGYEDDQYGDVEPVDYCPGCGVSV